MPTPESPYFFPVPSVVLVGIFHGYFYNFHSFPPLPILTPTFSLSILMSLFPEPRSSSTSGSTSTMQHLRSATTAIISSGESFAREHTTALAFGSTGFALATAPIAGPAILGAAGFGATGPVAASFAAVWQSSIGAVQAGSLFATLQSAAMGGAAAGAFTTASNIGIAMVGSVAIGTQWNYYKAVPRMGYDVKSTGKAGYCDSDQPDDGFDHRASNPQSCDKINCLEKEWAKLLQIDLS
ncbi:hypothetical protein M747DRAFT_318148 [Aspergillus niger ATCC 13496]|uniref:Contig An08c0280, genomic contig n=4 Tax=Aspergillus subgen. Circumdati TaxID=2720871 RepID=A2QSM1_ASPNC|nr:uncharacterized protein An08g11220 [Aspergillus niger]RDH16251.1 hypothetical protein M747DRAFT_318148 [Aspergillus niger ATCC 13496]CAK45793.1 unnamed protein product [Aspergillus niger]